MSDGAGKGELEKRIREILRYDSEKTPTYPPEIEDFAYSIFGKIVEEMRQDFPQIQLGNEIAAVKSLSVILDWKERWFGSSMREGETKQK